ncbi:MAG: GGDEF domain-containing protein [Edaphobacter sp.]|uniref:GGDEF domain-containing protein n=1 Tax=Edaphobacter sp. TaxID=1934404 RepID=UPI002386718D|nr:GGDEF domain-containing protein [Edaphobacter sp.]MDE1175268.1 GGDEF domain-containing protein [Edaphobacter sp.]
MDIHSLHVEHVVSLVLFTLLTFANSWHYKGMKGVNWFCGYSLFVLIGAIAVALRGHIPNSISILAGTIPVAVGYASLCLCLKDFFDRPTWHVYIHGTLLFLMTIAMVEYGVLHPDTARRLVVYSIILFFQQLYLAALLLQNRNPSLNIPAVCMLLMVCGLALSNLVRVIGVTLHGAPRDYLQAGPFLAWLVIINSCLQGGIMIAYVWMTAAMLRGKLEVQASTDPLTGALNRRGIELAAEQRILACRRDHQPLSAVVIDLDDFKHVNDTYGHHCGDATLIAVAACLQRGIRPRDILARIGGDEFAILLPNTPHNEALEITERLRTAVAATDIIYGQTRTRVTASFGLAQLETSEENWEQLFLNCDKILYDEKRSERHRNTTRTASAHTLEILPH